MISPDFDLTQNARLKAVWPSLWDVNAADELFRAVRDVASEAEYEAAITAYLSKSHFPPTPAAILELIEAARNAALAERRKAIGDTSKSHGEKWEDTGQMHTIQCGKWSMTIPKMKRMDSYRARCHMCFDTGWSTFYAAHNDAKTVWLWDEWDDISAEERGSITPQKALCRCGVGKNMPQRSEMVNMWHKGSDRVVPRYPLLEIVAKRAEIRRSNENEMQKMELVMQTEDALPF